MKQGSVFYVFAALALCLLLKSGICTGQTLTDSTIHHVEYVTEGNPSTALPVRGGQYVFVTVTNVGGPNYSTPDVQAGIRKNVVSGVEIFKNTKGTLVRLRFIRIGSKGANGMIALPGGNTVAISAGDEGLVFLNVKAAIDGTAKPFILSQGPGAGSWDSVVTPDGRYIFSANEYGIFQHQRGNIGVVAIELDRNGKLIRAHTIRRIPTGNKAPRLAISPDGSRLYVVREILPLGAVAHFYGKRNPLLTKHDCVQIKGIPPHANGLLTVIDVKRAIELASGEGSIITEMASGCSPVNVVETQDSSTLYVAARGDDRVLKFSPRLLEKDPDHAFLGALESGGDSPVGLRLLPSQNKLVVSNSDRFGASKGSVAIIDLSKPITASSYTHVPTRAFPRNITVANDDRTLYVANYTARTLEEITLR